jgi:predicted DNA-binding transcriptional regulator AlpA
MSGNCPQLDALLALARTAPAEELPRLLGQLREVEATAMARLTAPVPPPQPDELLDVRAAAARLGLSEDYLYRHHRTLPFARRVGRRVLFSSSGIAEFIAQKKPLATRR